MLTQGASGMDFKDAGTGSCTTNGTAHVYASGDTCTVDLTFTPTVPGQRLGAVQLIANGSAGVATAFINGTGTGPYITFLMNRVPVTVAAIPTTTGGPLYGIAVDGKGDVFFDDTVNGCVREAIASNGVAEANATLVCVGSGIGSPGVIAVDGAGNILGRITATPW